MTSHYIKFFKKKCLTLAILEYSVAQLIQLIINKRRSLIIIYRKKFLLNIKQRISGEFKIKNFFIYQDIIFNKKFFF